MYALYYQDSPLSHLSGKYFKINTVYIAIEISMQEHHKKLLYFVFYIVLSFLLETLN